MAAREEEIQPQQKGKKLWMCMEKLNSLFQITMTAQKSSTCACFVIFVRVWWPGQMADEVSFTV